MEFPILGAGLERIFEVAGVGSEVEMANGSHFYCGVGVVFGKGVAIPSL